MKRASMRRAAALSLAAVAVHAHAAGTQLLRFPNIWHDKVVFSYAGDLWTVSAHGGTATRLTSHPGLELFAKYSPDGRTLAFTAEYGGDEQVYVMSAEGGTPRQLTFYPSNGPLPERWGYDNQVYGWTADGSAVLFRSMRDAYVMSVSKLYTVPVNGGAASALPLPTAGAGSYSPDGKQIAYSPQWRDFRAEKRYQGGWANDLFIFDFGQQRLERITDDPHTDRDPMWIGGSVYFNSDRSGVFNLYRYEVSSKTTTELTHNKDFDVRWPSADAEGQIVYELNGGLHVYDTKSNLDRALEIHVPSDSTRLRAQPTNAAEHIESIALSPQGERLAIVGRGDVFSVPTEQGVTRNLTHSSNAHDREANWSHDGTRVVFVSDKSGEEELYVQAQNGTEAPRQITHDSKARYYAPRFSGDDKHIAFADQTNSIFVVDVDGKNRSLVGRDPFGPSLDYHWSPDGQFLAYSLDDEENVEQIHLYSVIDGKSRRVTPTGFNAHSPAFSPDGSLLYYLSEREYRPILSSIEFSFATDRQTGIFAIALRKDGTNPFGIRNDEPGDAKSRDKQKDKTAKSSRVDFDGIEQRVIRVPVEADNLSDLYVGEDSLLYMRTGPAYSGRSPGMKPTLVSYSIKDRESKNVFEDVSAWAPTLDGKHVAVELPSHEIKYLEVGKSDEAKAVSLAALETTRVPAEEWHEIFNEAWRRYRDFFYVENMHGFDWQALKRKYEPLLDSVAHRADLNYVIAEMIAELTVQHAYVQGGDLGLPPRPFVALPGARFELDAKSGRYRIATILSGENEEDVYRSPLTEVGVDVHVGDYVLAINGRELKAGTDPYELLHGPANQPVEWRVSVDPDGKAARSIRYNPLSSEESLLYLAWTAQNRARAEKLGAGRIGYIHVPDMGPDGLREFIKWWYPQVRREALIVDVRDNGGGNVSEMLIARLAPKLHGLNFGRHQLEPSTYPRAVQPGPKVALINEDTSSDGDIFAYQFKDWGLGKLIGKRTWGGVVGITDHGPLLDGGAIFVPEFGNADERGRWSIEGHGVDPDIVVEEDPILKMQGHDPQLERAVTELLKQLPASPQRLPPRPPAPDKSGGH